MADKEGDSEPKDQGKSAGQPSEKDGDTAALIRQLLAALEKQQEKPGNSSKGKLHNTERPLHPGGCEILDRMFSLSVF